MIRQKSTMPVREHQKGQLFVRSLPHSRLSRRNHPGFQASKRIATSDAAVILATKVCRFVRRMA